MDSRRLAILFDAAVEMPPGQADEWLKCECATDEALLQAARRLLRADANATGFLNAPLDVVAWVASGANPEAPERFGPYRVLRSLGVGGMGEVWLGERVDGGFEQRVAIKQLAYPTPALLHRFRQERQILAQLEHPGIARLLDGGADAHGAPYLVMEYVEGEPITHYAQAHRLHVTAKLTLFMKVCAAVQYAHQNLIVHRDLKPSNILVTTGGEVKLLDFGIAKLLATTAPETRTATRLMTPGYAAPEQIAGAAITTATDVYALGVLLHELLTGAKPVRDGGGEATDTTRPPSLVARTSDRGLRRALRGDLDRIVLTALAPDPQRRYVSPAELAQDVRLHLQGQPIAARGHDRWYRMRRFIRRRRYVLAAVVTVLVVSLTATAISMRHARIAHDQAVRAEAVQAFVTDLFRANTSAQPDPVKARATTASELLELGARRISGEMNDAPEAKYDLLKLFANLHLELALDDEAVRLFREAADLAGSVYGSRSLEHAAALIELGKAMHASSAVNERGTILTEALGILDSRNDTSSLLRAQLLSALAEHYSSSDVPRALAYSRANVELLQSLGPSVDLAEAAGLQGLVEINSGLWPEALQSYQKAIAISRAVEGNVNPSLPRFYAYLGDVQWHLLDVAGALASARQALDVATAVNGEEHVDALQTRMRLGMLLMETGQTGQGLELLRQAERLSLKIRGPDDPFHTPQMRFELGKALATAGRLHEGLAQVELAIANRRRNRPGTRYLATMLEQSAVILTDLGRNAEALQRLGESTAIRVQVGTGPPSLAYNSNLAAQIRLALAEGRVADGKRLLAGYTVDPERISGTSMSELEYRLLAAQTSLAAGEDDQALLHAQRVASDLDRLSLGSYMQHMRALADFIAGSAELYAGRPSNALPLLLHALEMRQRILLPESPRLMQAHVAVARCLLALGRRDEARVHLDAARASRAGQTGIADEYERPLRALEKRLGNG